MKDKDVSEGARQDEEHFTDLWPTNDWCENHRVAKGKKGASCKLQTAALSLSLCTLSISVQDDEIASQFSTGVNQCALKYLYKAIIYVLHPPVE